MGVINLIYRAMKSKYRAINGKLVRSHVIGCHARCFRGRHNTRLQQLESSFLTGLAMPFLRDSKSHVSRDKIEFQNITFQSIGGIQI